MLQWKWEGENYKLVQYIIEDEKTLEVNKFECEYRAIYRIELMELLINHGCRRVDCAYEVETGYFQPILIAKK